MSVVKILVKIKERVRIVKEASNAVVFPVGSGNSVAKTLMSVQTIPAKIKEHAQTIQEVTNAVAWPDGVDKNVTKT